MIKQELTHLFKNKLLLFVMIVILMIPAIYAGMFLNSMWDPYGEIGKLPVAVVNKDVPVAYNGKTLAVGDNLETSLKNKKLQSSVAQMADASNQLLPASSKAMSSLLSGMQSVQSGLGNTVAENGQMGIVEGMTNLDDGIRTLNAGISGTDGMLDGVLKLKSGSMMSVGLWVGCLAFCLMYPLVRYYDKLKNGFAWFMSKAVILYPTAVIMALVLYFT